MSEQRQCNNCKCEDRLDFGVTDDCWNRVVPKTNRGDIICLNCFDLMAHIKQVNWTDQLQYVRFLGKAGEFRHRPVP